MLAIIMIVISSRQRPRRRAFLARTTRVGFITFTRFWPLAYQAHHVAQANTEQSEIDHHEHHQGHAQLGVAVIRNPVGSAHKAVDHPRLATDLSGEPTCENRDQAGRPHPQGQVKERPRAVELVTLAQP
ncbi:hypothetical protein D3C76_1518030 [compost metagenome]